MNPAISTMQEDCSSMRDGDGGGGGVMVHSALGSLWKALLEERTLELDLQAECHL